MRAVFILIIMVFLHLIADYHLQGVLATMKQKDWWARLYKSDAERERYGGDYKTALMAHAAEWAFVVTLPCLRSLYNRSVDMSWQSIRYGVMYIAVLMFSMLVHYVIDDLKANDKKINLAEDQILHLAQIVVVWMAWSVWVWW